MSPTPTLPSRMELLAQLMAHRAMGSAISLAEESAGIWYSPEAAQRGEARFEAEVLLCEALAKTDRCRVYAAGGAAEDGPS